jgi:hypothetical protein
MVVYRLLAVVCVCLGLAFAQDYKFVVAYEDPADDIQAQYKTSLEQAQFLESLIKDFENISLPENIGVVGAPCGDANAYWDPTARAMIVCYELFDLMYAMFRDDAQSQEDLDNEVFGATRFIFYHELGHALVDIFGIPFTGREEDAVDQFSTMLLLNGNDVNSALAGANFFYKFASVTELEELVFYGEHSLDQQRFYDIVCLVYGSDPETYDYLLQRDTKGFLLNTEQGYLPKERADRCYEEYKDISNSWSTLIASYVTSKDGSGELAISTTTTPTLAVADVLGTKDYTETFTGTLQEGDDTLDDGEYFDYYDIELVQGQEVTFELSSTDFDTYLIVSAPDEFGYVNDDATIKVDGYLSKLTIPISTSGTWTIGVSSYEKGQVGNYQVGVVTYDSIYNEVLAEDLADGDAAYETGELVDSYEYSFEAGQNATIVLSSLDFDPYLVVTTPSGETFVNDDFENQFGMARVDFSAPEAGTYTISATSYATGEKGPYQIAISNVGAPLPVNTIDAGTDANGDLFSDLQEATLSSGDSAYDSGEFYDTYSYDFEVGQNIIVDAISSEFNTYLEVQYPDGEKYFNDDYKDDGSTDAGLDVLIEEAGTYTFYVSSSKTGETGNYALYISDTGPQDATGTQVASEPGTAAEPDGQLFEDEQYGALSAEDSAYETGEYFDIYTYEFTVGQNIFAGTISDVFDTYLSVTYPNGEQYGNDNYEEDTTDAYLNMTIEEAGTYTFYVSSAKASETGDYSFYVSDLGSEDNPGTQTEPTGTQASTEDPVEETNIDVTDLTSTRARNSNIGVLENGDNTLDDGSYVDYYSVDLEAGQQASFNLVSADFNTYLGVMKPNGEIVDLGQQQSSSRSGVTLDVEETGTWFVFVTTASAGEDGNYLLSIKK